MTRSPIAKFLLFSTAFLCACAASAKNDDGRFDASPHREWFESLKDASGMSCCGLGDAHFTNDYTFNSDRSAVVRVVVEGREHSFVVPPEKVLMDKVSSNPTGRGVIFLSVDLVRVFCFVPVPQV